MWILNTFLVNTKGRYGYLVNLMTTMFDFVLLNLVYVILCCQLDGVEQFKSNTTWLFLNISYLPVLSLFSEVHKKRILFADRLMTMLCQAFVVHCLVMMAFMTIIGFDAIPIKVYAYFYIFYYASLALWWNISRRIIKYFRRKGLNFRKIVIIGWNGTSKQLYRELQSDQGYGYRIVGIFDNNKHKDVKITGKISDFEEFLKKETVDEIYCSLPSEEENVGNIIKIADSNDVEFYYVPMISGFMTTNFKLTSIGDLPMLLYRPNPLQRLRNRVIKRIFDIIVSVIAIVLVSCTILIPVIIAIKLSSKGPIFFAQKRTGYRGREFTCYKFRTMRVNAQADTLQATKDDPRKTKVGDFLRKTSIDELPQFFNVLIGNMSVVGPRPHMVKHTDEYRKLIDKYMVRHMIKPGITGLAQVSGYRGQTEELWQMEKRVEYDVKYIESWTLSLDIKIIVRTIINAVKGEKNAF